METTLVIPEVEQLSIETRNELQGSFEPLFKQAQDWKKKADSIRVVDINDKDGMAAAREARLELKRIRVEADKIRVKLKEESLLKGKAIDGMFNIIKFLVVPIETQLEEQEKYAELEEEKRINAIVEDRVTKIAPYIEDLSIFNFRMMSDEQFEPLLENARKAHEYKLAAEKKAEEERLAKEKAEQEERERIQKENEKLKQEAEDREARIAAERKAQAEKEAKEKATREAQEKKDREVAEAKLKVEREAKEKAEAELKAKQEAEERAKAEAEKAKQEREAAEAEAARQASLAPDKDKLRKLAADLLAVEYPEMSSKEGKKVVDGVKVLMQKVRVYIVENVDSI
jgi:hypothetical protein